MKRNKNDKKNCISLLGPIKNQVYIVLINFSEFIRNKDKNIKKREAHKRDNQTN